MEKETFDGDGSLTDPGIWNEDLALRISSKEGVGDLSDEHWANPKNRGSFPSERPCLAILWP